MKQTTVSILIHLYAWLLRLYPSGFRDEFGDEMTAVFNDVLADYITKCQPLDIDLAIIDEAQDLSPLQWEMVEHMTAKCPEIYYAGDDDQAIYSWAGADVNHFLNLV